MTDKAQGHTVWFRYNYSTAAYSAQSPLEGADRMQMEVKEDNGGNKNILIFDVTPVLMLHSPSP